MARKSRLGMSPMRIAGMADGLQLRQRAEEWRTGRCWAYRTVLVLDLSMPAFDPAMFAALLGLLGLVILAAGALSGIFEKVGLPLVALFLGLGTILGPYGLGLIAFERGLARAGHGRHAEPGAGALHRRACRWTSPKCGAISSSRWSCWDPGPCSPRRADASRRTGCSTCPGPPPRSWARRSPPPIPVMVRGLLRQRGIPAAARTALRMESGLNDVVVLPVVLVGMAFSRRRAGRRSMAGAITASRRQRVRAGAARRACSWGGSRCA